ncbi:unnamed protein product, partial [Rotaria sordida]
RRAGATCYLDGYDLDSRYLSYLYLSGSLDLYLSHLCLCELH